MKRSSPFSHLSLNRVPTFNAQYLPPREIDRLKRKRKYGALRGIPNLRKRSYAFQFAPSQATALNIKESLAKGFPFYVEVNNKGNMFARRRYLLFEQELCRSGALGRYLTLVDTLLNSSYESFLKNALNECHNDKYFVDIDDNT